MDLLVNIVFAWITVILMALLSVVYLLRIVNQKFYGNQHEALKKINKALRKPHKYMGIAAVVTGLLHGLYSTVAVLTPNKGTILWVVLILLGVSFYLRKVLIRNRSWIKVHRVLVAASLALLILHVLEVGGFVGYEAVKMAVQSDLVEDTQEESTQLVEAAPSSVYKDGTYYGEAIGFRPGLKVEVVIENDEIMSVEVVEHNEHKERFWGPPIREIPPAIVENQSTDVDIISGATFTSQGIMDAVDKALEEAKN